MKLLFIISIFLFTSLNGFSNESNFDSLYIKTSREILGIAPEEVLHNVDYLYKVATNDTNRIRSLILKAEFLMYYGLNDEAQIILFDSEKLALKINDYVSLTRIYGMIASIYRMSELYSSNSKYLEKASLAIDKIEDINMRWRFKGNLEQEKANIEMEKKNYKQAIVHAHNSIDYLLKIGPITRPIIHFQLTISNGILSKNYLSLNEIDSSFYYLKIAQENFNLCKNPGDPLLGFIYNGLAEAHLANKSYAEAEEYFLKAKKIAEEANYFDLKKDVYKAMSAFYKETGLEEKSISFNKKFIELIEQDERSRKLIADKLLDSLYDQQSILEAKEHKNAKIITSLIVLSFLLVSIIIWYIYKKKQNQKKFQAYINELNKKPIKEAISSESEDTKSYMSKEKELSILQDLEDIEKTEFYLDENISLGVFSGKMGINQRYITYVIKKHKKADFATYINELRIDYIVNLIKSDPKYLEYKISYLAEQCGFSSHSRFSINFKKITGTTPSAFISYVREENEKEQKSA